MPRPAIAPDLSLLNVAGSPREMGRAQGEHWRDAVREVCEARVRSTIDWAGLRGRRVVREALLPAMQGYLEAHQRYDPSVWEEFSGLAEGAGVDPALLMIGNGYTDIRDYVTFGATDTSGCTTFTATGEATADGEVLLGQTWDMDLSMLPYVYICRRQPDDGPETLVLTTCGCLSLVGVNEHGVAVGNSNIAPRDARPGVIYLALIHRALAQRDAAAAQAAICDAERASGHHYYLADPTRAVHLETTAERWAELPRDGACHAQSNHYRHDGFADVAVPPPPEARSDERRCELLHGLERHRPLTVDACQRALESRAVTVEQPLLRAITCAAIILRPASREMWATHGPPTRSAWHRYCL